MIIESQKSWEYRKYYLFTLPPTSSNVTQAWNIYEHEEINLVISMILLTTLQTLFRFSNFSTYVFFLFQFSNQDATSH